MQHFRGVHAGGLPKVAGEVRLTDEVQLVADLRYGVLPTLEESLGFGNDKAVDMLTGIAAAFFVDELGKVLGTEAELVGIELDVPFLGKILFHQVQKTFVEILVVGLFLILPV